MVSFAQYQVPGTYVEAEAASLTAPVGVPISTVAIVGQSRGYQLATETITVNLTPKALKNKGVLPDSHESPDLVVTKTDGTVLVEDTDYELVRGGSSADSTTIARVTSSTEIANDDLVIVSYAYADSTYYSPKNFEEYGSIESVYGSAMVSEVPEDPDATQVNSPLTLAARIAFENGAASVITVAVEPTTVDFDLGERYEQAYAKIATVPEATLLVPVFSQQAEQSDSAYTASLAGLTSTARAHCVAATDAGYRRICFVGYDTGYDDDDIPFDEAAGSNSSRRVVLAFPSRMRYYNAALNASTEVGGPYLAAALAGRLAAQQANRGLTRLQVFSFQGIPQDLLSEMTHAQKNLLSSSGVCVVEPGRNSALVVRHGVSTDMTDILSSEVSITRAQDALYRMVYDGIENSGLIGEPIDEDLTIRVKGIIQGLLGAAVDDNIIVEWVDLQVRQQPSETGNPTIVECRFTYRPFLPLNYITVSFSMDLTTGDVVTGEEIAA